MKLSSVRSEWPEIYAWPTRLDGEPAPLRCNMCSKRGTRALARARQHMVSRGRKYRREIEASRVRRAYRGQTRKRTVVCRASHGRERHLTFDDSHWEILSRRERERERERKNVARVSRARVPSRTRFIVVVSLDFYTCDIPSLINIYLSNSRIRTPSGPIIVVISPMLAPLSRPLVLAARFRAQLRRRHVRSTHRLELVLYSPLTLSRPLNWPTASVSCRVTKRARCVLSLILETTDRNALASVRRASV